MPESNAVEGRPLDEDESQLVERARGRDVRAYESLVRRYQDLAYRTAYLITGSGADADDAAQEGLVKAWYALDRFRAGARCWLLSAACRSGTGRRSPPGSSWSCPRRRQRASSGAGAAP